MEPAGAVPEDTAETGLLLPGTLLAPLCTTRTRRDTSRRRPLATAWMRSCGQGEGTRGAGWRGRCVR